MYFTPMQSAMVAPQSQQGSSGNNFPLQHDAGINLLAGICQQLNACVPSAGSSCQASSSSSWLGADHRGFPLALSCSLACSNRQTE